MGLKRSGSFSDQPNLRDLAAATVAAETGFKRPGQGERSASRRLRRDVVTRQRSRDSIREQFWKMVEPMHVRHVQPQAAKASVVLKRTCGKRELAMLIEEINRRLRPG